VPRLEGARACVWLGIGLLGVLGWLHAPEEPAGWQVVRSEAEGCVLAPLGGPGAACPCEQAPASVRRILGLPLPLERASAADLQVLPGIGPRRAQAIVEERTRRGFRSVGELVRVRGVGPATVAQLGPALFLGTPDPACAPGALVIRSAVRPRD